MGARLKQNLPNGIMKVVNNSLLVSNGIWKYPLAASKELNTVHLASLEQYLLGLATPTFVS